MPLFFTLPPMEIPYPYVLINAHRPEEGLRYIARHRRFIEAVIIDSGVEIFRHNPGMTDYPGGLKAWVARLASLYRRVKSLVPDAEVVATVPDYPDDYRHRQFWLSDEVTNIERTVESIDYALTHYNDVDWLVPIQGWYEQPESIITGLVEAEAVGALDYAEKLCRRTQHVPCVAIAMLCVSRRCSTIITTVRYAVWWLRKMMSTWPTPRKAYSVRVHIFGPAVNCIREVAHYIHSFDSLAWTKPRKPGGSSCWSNGERVYLFLTFLHKYADLIELPEHPLSMRKRLAVAR